MKIQIERVQADSLQEIQEIERNITHQKDYHSIAARDTKENQENYIMRFKD